MIWRCVCCRVCACARVCVCVGAMVLVGVLQGVCLCACVRVCECDDIAVCVLLFHCSEMTLQCVCCRVGFGFVAC